MVSSCPAQGTLQQALCSNQTQAPIFTGVICNEKITRKYPFFARIYKLFSCTFISYCCCNLQSLPSAAPPSNQRVKLALSTIGSQVVVAINIKHGQFSSLKHRQFSSLKHGQFSSLKYSSPKLTLFNI